MSYTYTSKRWVFKVNCSKTVSLFCLKSNINTYRSMWFRERDRDRDMLANIFFSGWPDPDLHMKWIKMENGKDLDMVGAFQKSF